MQNLVIDIGNTRTKVAIFENNEMVVRYTTDTVTAEDIESMKNEYPLVENAILSSVRNDTSNLLVLLKQHFRFAIELDHNTCLPLENLYETPHTLGKDRIAAAVGANSLYPNQNLLIIDAGTAVTYDFVNNKNQYMGGFITPGLSMRFKALHHFTDRLPLLNTTQPESYMGTNTTQSIIGGIQYGLEGELNRIIQLFTDKANNLFIILTGGDTNYFDKLLKKHNFVALEITLLGLNTILASNIILDKKNSN
jgi:type III pantothenate kinase